MINKHDSPTIDDYKSKATDKYPKLFKELGGMKNSYCMTHIEDTKPFQVSVPIKEIPFPLYQETKEELTWVCERRTRGVHRGKIFVKTDHKTTLPECSYTEARSADMQRFRMRLMRFHSKEIKYVSQGKKEYMAGAPSSEVNK